jgi:hypothetical protein
MDEHERFNSTKLIESRLFVSLILDKYLSDTDRAIDTQDMNVIADILMQVENWIDEYISAMEEAANA